ncbi:hypothetical protein Ancab_018157 [Ancistrocladus abbreviatus]
MKAMETLQDLIEEAKVRALWWAMCIFAISYFLSHTSKSMWMNIPVSIIIAMTLRMLVNQVEFHWKIPQANRKPTYLSHLVKKQLSVNDSHLSTALPPPNWKKKIDSPIVEAAIEEFIDKILRDFVIDLWYSDITPDKEAPELMRAIILDALGEVAARVKEVNIVDLLTRDIVDLIGDHIELYRRKQAAIGVDVMGTLSSEERDDRLKHHLMASQELHPALISPESEYKFLQHLMGGVLAVVLTQREAQCPLVRCMAREFVTCLVVQPVMNFASPMYINEVVEYLFLSGIDIFSRTDGGSDHSAKAHHCHSVHAENMQNAESTLGKHEIAQNQETYMRLAKSENCSKQASGCPESFSSNTPHGESIQTRTADWARVLDAATQRRTEVLAPENLENMWARGRHYKDKLNARGTQAPGAKAAATISTMPVKESVKETLTNKTLNVATDGNNNVVKTPEDVDKESSSLRSSPLIDQVENTSSLALNVNKIRLKRSNSTSALRSEPDEKRANIGESKDLIVSEEFYSADFGRRSLEYSKVPSDSVTRAEGSHFPKLWCRVVGAYFEKIGSKSFAVYSIAVTDSGNNTWSVKRRYRNFERLHRHLKDIPNYMLHLPPKRIFSSSTEDAFVHQRCIQLDKYLQDLLSIANVAEQHEVWDFLSVSSKNYSFGKSSSVMRTLAVNVDDAVDDIVRQFKGVSDGLMRKVVGSSPSHYEGSSSTPSGNLAWHADELKRHISTNSSLETTNSFSDNEEGEKDENHGLEEAETSARANGWHSDNELDSKDFLPRVFKRTEDYRTVDFEKKHLVELKSQWKDTWGTASLPAISGHLEDPIGVPPEWTPPNVCVPVLNLVDKIFQLNRRGWIRRQVFWISKQILQLVMEDAIDDWLLQQISWLRRDDVIAQGIRWIQDVLWPDGKFFLKLDISQKADESEFGCSSSQNTSCSAGSRLSPPGSFELQLEAARRASDVKKMIFNGAPTALVSLIGHKQYGRCARDIYFFLQSSICVKQVAYAILELLLISIFPELRDLVVDAHKKMRIQSA